MAIRLTTTKEATLFAKILVYGRSGIGKTKLIQTVPKPIIISGEKGLLSLRQFKDEIPAIEILDTEGLYEAFDIVTGKKGIKFETICIDSITDIAEVILSDFKKSYKDPRKAYMDMSDEVTKIIRLFRDINDKHVYMTAKAKRITQEDGGDCYFPSMPGNSMILNLPYFFDEVLAMRIQTDEDGKKRRVLQTQPDEYYDAKDRSGNLNEHEPPHLGKIIKKIIN